MNKIKNKRPLIITILCIIGVFGAVGTIPLIFSNGAKQIGFWYPPTLTLSAIVGGISIIGLWMMKKWGVLTYIVMVVINQVVMITMGVWNIFSLVIPGIAIVLMSSKYSQME